MIAKTKNVLKKTSLALSLSLVGYFGAPAPAHAVAEPAFYAFFSSEWTPFLEQYTAFVSEVDDQFFAINEYLAEIYQYMATDTGNTQGMGIIGAINANQNKIWKQQQDFTETTNKNVAQMNRVTATDGAVSSRIANSMADPRNCSEIPRVMGARSGGGGGGSRGTKGVYEARVANAGGGTAPNATSQAATIVATHAGGAGGNNYCATPDVTYTNGKAHAAFGCSAPGNMPDGDARVASLFVPAHDFTKPDVVAQQTLTFTPQTAKAAGDAIITILSSFSPPGLPEDVEKSPEGKLYLAKVKVFNARLSPALHALTSITSMRNPDPNAMNNTDFKTTWSTVATPVFANLFPNSKPPEVPSEAEIMRFEVLRRYADFGDASWHGQLIKDQDQARLLIELNTTAAVQLYLDWQLHNRLEENNALQSAILAQLTNPVTINEMDAAARAAYGTRK